MTDTTELDRLKALAEGAKAHNDLGDTRAIWVDPDALLSLIARIERLQAWVESDEVVEEVAAKLAEADRGVAGIFEVVPEGESRWGEDVPPVTTSQADAVYDAILSAYPSAPSEAIERVVEAAQYFGELNPEIMDRGHGEPYVKIGSVPLRRFHELVQALAALEREMEKE